MSNITKSSFTSENALTYPDIPAVLAGLARMRGDIWDLANEIDPAIAVVTQTVQAPGDKSLAHQALKNQQAQLVWLAAETGAMLAAIAKTDSEDGMQNTQQKHGTTDALLKLYLVAEALEHIARYLPERSGGLAYILQGLGKDVHRLTASIDDKTE